jgi:hypothetical protein
VDSVNWKIQKDITFITLSGINFHDLFLGDHEGKSDWLYVVNGEEIYGQSQG